MNAREPNICICPQAHRFSVWSSKLRTCIVLSHTACSKGRIQWTVLPSFSFLNSPLGTLIHFERAMSASVAGGNCQTWQTAELLPFSKPSQVIDWEKKRKIKKSKPRMGKFVTETSSYWQREILSQVWVRSKKEMGQRKQCKTEVLLNLSWTQLMTMVKQGQCLSAPFSSPRWKASHQRQKQFLTWKSNLEGKPYCWKCKWFC